MRHQLPVGRSAPRRLTKTRQAQLDSAASAPEREALLAEIRLTHIRAALADAVQADRITVPAANQVVARLERGEDPHAIRRELRHAGVLLRRDITPTSTPNTEQTHD